MKRSRTSPFGVGKRQAHDASTFYDRQRYATGSDGASEPAAAPGAIPQPPITAWADRMYPLVFAKESFARPDRGSSDIGRDEFTAATLSVWEIPPESARRVGHPAPFPVALAERVVQLYSYVNDVVLDPFAGSGTTCVAAARHGRHYAGYELSPEYCALAEARLGQEVTG